MCFKFKESENFYNSLSSLKGGDVLLCTGKSKKNFDPIGTKISEITSSSYVHAALYLENNIVIEAIKNKGVSKKNIENFLKKYKHCVVLRRNEAWTQDRINLLKTYTEELTLNKTKYNSRGALELGKSLTTDSSTINKINILLKTIPESNDLNNQMFCSQLVATCFIITGFIGDNAKQYFNPAETAPINLAIDKVYGDFLGYIWSNESYQVSKEDELYYNMY